MLFGSHSGSATFSLLHVEDVPGTIELAPDGAVVETDDYQMTVSFYDRARLRELQISVNGEDPYRIELGQPSTRDDGSLDYVVCFPSNHGISASRRLFLNTYGFARVEMIASFEGMDAPVVLSTKDIPCLGRDDQDAQNAEKMLTELLDSDDTLASKWMFSGSSRPESPYSILDGSLQDNSPKSLSSMVHLIERVLVAYSAHQEYFRAHGYSRIISKKTKLPVRRIRRAGNSELLWISKNLQTLSETPSENGIEYAGSYYLPTMVETQKRVRTFDSYENRLVLGFLEEVLRTARAVRAALVKGSSSIRALEERLSSLSAASYTIPALALVRSYSIREKSYLTQIDALIGKAQELLRLYRFFMQGVEPKHSRNPRRTKVFQELRPYAQIYDLLLEWLAFGEFSLAKEGLALHALRADKLYEYYVLYRILSWFEERGFVADATEEKAIYVGEYHADELYRPETQVSTIYNLIGNNTKVRLYYQPVIHGNRLEDEGISLHRLSSSSYWSPDYLLRIITDGGKKSYHVIDAKYSNPNCLRSGYPKSGTFSECMMKYRQDIGGITSDEMVSTVWLLAGKGYRQQPIFAEHSRWAKEHFDAPRSGIGSLTPLLSHLDGYFKEICPNWFINTIHNEDSEINHVTVSSPIIHSLEEDESTPTEIGKAECSVVASTTAKQNVPQTTQRNQVKRVSHQRLDEGTVSLVKKLIVLLNGDEKLFDDRWARRELGMNHPLLRKRLPSGRERRNYKPMEIDGEELYVYANWLPNQKNKLNAFMEKYPVRNEG